MEQWRLKHKAMKMYGRVETYLHTLLYWAILVVNGQLHAPPAEKRRAIGTHCVKEAG
jgi:hypothetical protein